MPDPAPRRRDRLCALAEIPDRKGKGFNRAGLGDRGDFFVVRQGVRAVAYLNDCPHARLPLDIIADQFISRLTGDILCANHGALFRVADGACIAGPCPGTRLQPVAIEVRDGAVYLTDPRAR